MGHCDTNISPSVLDSVPSGRWGVAVSGGADSVALLLLAVRHPSIETVAIHLDHQTRQGQSREDAAFVATLCQSLGVPLVSSTLSDVEAGHPSAEANPSARFRAARQALFATVVRERGLQGVLVAHHADDQAETVLLRLLRGSGIAGLAGMREVTTFGPLVVRRPLLSCRRSGLRAYLTSAGIAWREDPTNASPEYRRSIARKILANDDALTAALLALGEAARRWREFLAANVPALPDRFPVTALGNLPSTFALEAARRWLIRQGVPPDAVAPDGVQRLHDMARDAASPARLDFPNGITARRNRGSIFAEHRDR